MCGGVSVYLTDNGKETTRRTPFFNLLYMKMVRTLHVYVCIVYVWGMCGGVCECGSLFSLFFDKSPVCKLSGPWNYVFTYQIVRVVPPLRTDECRTTSLPSGMGYAALCVLCICNENTTIWFSYCALQFPCHSKSKFIFPLNIFIVILFLCIFHFVTFYIDI